MSSKATHYKDGDNVVNRESLSSTRAKHAAYSLRMDVSYGISACAIGNVKYCRCTLKSKI